MIMALNDFIVYLFCLKLKRRAKLEVSGMDEDNLGLERATRG